MIKIEKCQNKNAKTCYKMEHFRYQKITKKWPHRVQFNQFYIGKTNIKFFAAYTV